MAEVIVDNEPLCAAEARREIKEKGTALWGR